MRNYIFAGFRFRLLLVVLSGFFLVPDLAADDVADALRARAAGLYSERAYEQAHKAWQQLAAHGIPEAERPKLDFFIADSLWRSQSGREQLEEARGILTGIIENAPESALAAEAWESLGDSWLASDRDWPRAWEAYQEALAYWAGSTDSELARERYLGIVWKATGPPTDAHRVALVPLEVLNNALRIARSDENVARARFFLGVWLSDQGDPFSLRRAGSEWSQVIAMGSGTAVYESALFRLAQWALVAGSSDWQPDGSLEIGPNSQRAFGLFKRFLAEFPVSGDSIYSAEAAAQIAELTRSELSVSVDRNYLPGSEPLVVVEARNVPSVEISLYRVDLLSAFQPQPTTDPDRWDDAIRISDLVPVRQWTHPIDGEQPLEATRAELSLEMIEEPGTYVLEAGGAGLTARTLILVSTTAAVFKSGTDEAVAMICDVGSGRAYPDATATLWQAVREDAGIWKWTPIQKSDRSGALVHFVLPADNERTTASLVLLAEAD